VGKANGSRERAPDDRLREAIHFAAKKEKNGLLRRFAPRNDGFGSDAPPRCFNLKTFLWNDHALRA
jgi:hypothetical protein